MKFLRIIVAILALAANNAAWAQSDTQLQTPDTTYGIISSGNIKVTPNGGTQTTLGAALSPQGLNLTGANTSGANVTPTGGTSAAALSAAILGAGIVTDSLYGAGGVAPPVGNGVTDDATSLQAMATAVPAAGGVMYLRWNASGQYLLGTPLLLHSNTTLVCQPGVTFRWKNPFTNLAFSSVAHGGNGALVSNQNWNAATILDHDITVIDCGADGTAFTNNGNHAFGFRGVKRPLIIRPRCDTMGDCTAMQLTDGSVVEDGYAENMSNACFDHWEGVINYSVSIIYCRSSLYGLLATGTNSNETSAQTSSRGSFTGGTVEITGAGGAAVDLNGLGPAAWRATFTFYAGDMAANASNYYTQTVASCVSSSASPPTGTGSGIADGTCSWNFTNTAGVGEHGAGVQFTDIKGVHVKYTNSATGNICYNITGTSEFNRVIGGDCYQGTLYIGGDAGGFALYNTIDTVDVVAPNAGSSGAAALMDTGTTGNVINNVRVGGAISGNIGFSFFDAGTNATTNAHPNAGFLHFPTGRFNSLYSEADPNVGSGGIRVLSGSFGSTLPVDSGAVFVASASVTNGATQTMGQNSDGLMLQNASAVSTQTVKLPVINTQSGQAAWIGSVGGITTLTVQTSAGGAITGAPTSIAAGGMRKLISDGTTWWPVQ